MKLEQNLVWFFKFIIFNKNIKGLYCKRFEKIKVILNNDKFIEIILWNRRKAKRYNVLFSKDIEEFVLDYNRSEDLTNEYLLWKRSQKLKNINDGCE